MKDNIFIIQCLSGQETNLSTQLQKFDSTIQIFLPKRELKIRRKGVTKKETKLLFPGYIFISNVSNLNDFFIYAKPLEGFLKFLWKNTDIRPLPMDEAKIILALLNNGNPILISKGIKENGEVHIMEGPLKNLSGKIVKIDHRKQRAKIKIKFFNRIMYTYLGLEILEKK